MSNAPAVYAAIAAVAAELSHSGIAKERRNQQQGYAFRGIDDVLNALSPFLAKHKLLILPRVLSRSTKEQPTKSGGVLFYTVVEVEFHFVCTLDGSTHVVKTYGEAMDSADKSTNKAMSAAYKYAAFQSFCIPLEGEAGGDADDTTPEPGPTLDRSDAQAPQTPAQFNRRSSRRQDAIARMYTRRVLQGTALGRKRTVKYRCSNNNHAVRPPGLLIAEPAAAVPAVYPSRGETYRSASRDRARQRTSA